MKFIFRLLIAFFCCLLTMQVSATHAMGGDITYVCIGPNQYSIVAKLFRDCNGIVLPNDITVNVASQNCGYNQGVTLTNLNGATNSYITPLCDASQDACLGNGVYGVEQYFYRGIVTLPSCVNGDDFVISWSTCCRNGAITTLVNPGSIYIYADLDNTLTECNSSPAFNFEPTVYLCLGKENYFNHGITDLDSDKLVFSLTDCLEGAGFPVTYNTGFSGTQPLTTSSLTIDSETGQIDLIPIASGEVGVICVLVEEYRSGIKIGETIRDLQFTVIDCGTNDLPIVSGINGTASSLGVTGSYDYTSCVGEEIEFTITSYDAQAVPTIASQDLTMDWGVGVAGASFIIDDTTNTLPSATFRWTPTVSDVGTNFFTVKIQDDACLFNGISVFTYKIEVQASGLNYSPNISVDTTINDNSILVIDVNSNNFGPGFQFFWSTNTSDSVLSCYNCPDPLFTPIPGLGATYEIYMVYRDLGSVTNCVLRDTFTIHTVVNTNQITNLLKNVTITPNPFATNAMLSYHLNQGSEVVIEVFNMVGQKVGTLVNEKQPVGEHQLQIGDAINQVKGIYFVRLSIDGEVLTKKILIQ